MTTPLAYDVAGAAAASGYSVDVIRRAIRAGDLRTAAGTVDGKAVSKKVIRADDLAAWLRAA